jgi:hypothetical protein
MLRYFKALRHAFEGGIVEGEDVVFISLEAFGVMVRMNRIHPLKVPYPGRILNLKDTIRMQATTLQRVARKSFVVRRTKHESLVTVELDESQVIAGHPWLVLNIVREQNVILIGQDERHRRANTRLWHAIEFYYSVSLVYGIHFVFLNTVDEARRHLLIFAVTRGLLSNFLALR